MEAEGHHLLALASFRLALIWPSVTLLKTHKSRMDVL